MPAELSIPNTVIAESNRLRWVSRLRPAALQILLLKLFRHQERRTIIRTKVGVDLYVDPMSGFGNFLVTTGEYEPDMCALISEHLPVGGTFVDIGGNEGFLSCLAAQVAGPLGRVILVEPQARLFDIIRINLALNDVKNCQVVMKALSDEPSVVVSLWPGTNNGASSIVRPYRWNANPQIAETISFGTLLDEFDIPMVDLVKVDVEGYEKEVVDSMLPALRSGRVGTILIEYHESILQRRNIDWHSIEGEFFKAGLDRIDDARLFRGDGLAAYHKRK